MSGIRTILKGNMENVLLTGATGFVGRKLLKESVDLGYKVRCIVRDKKKLDKIETYLYLYLFIKKEFL